MNNTIKSHPRTVLAGALSVALMFAAGGVMAQDADHDRQDRTATENMDSDQPMGDTWITTKVKSSLLADSDVAGLDVEVETVNGVVHLRGNVDNQTQIDRATEIARDIEGVTNVDASGLTSAAGTSDF
ncbi:BON domain-containing protein [Luteimonas sp. A478]